MALNMKECSKRARNGEKETISGPMAHSLWAPGSKITLRGKENTSGQTEECTMENGRIINFMVKESTLGLMADVMKENTKMIKNTGTDPTIGQMASPMKASGMTENNMERQDLQTQKERANTACGRMEKESSGLMERAR